VVLCKLWRGIHCNIAHQLPSMKSSLAWAFMFPCESKVERHILVGEDALNELCPAKLLSVKRVLLRSHVESGINYNEVTSRIWCFSNNIGMLREVTGCIGIETEDNLPWILLNFKALWTSPCAGFQLMDAHMCNPCLYREHFEIWSSPTVSG
jgi:hypothetical protein